MHNLSGLFFLARVVEKRDCAWGCARGINTTWKNLQIAKHKSVRWAELTPSWFVLFNLQIFSGGVYHPERNLTHNLFFLFPIVFGINLIHFFDGKKDGAVGNSIVCFGSSIHVTPVERATTKSANCLEECNVFDNGKCELSAIWEGRNWGAKFWKGKVQTHCQFQRYCSDVTSVFLCLSVCLSVCLSLSLSLSLSFFLSLWVSAPHAQ